MSAKGAIFANIFIEMMLLDMRRMATVCCAVALCAMAPMIADAQGTAAVSLAEDVKTIHDGGNGLPQKYDGTGVTIGLIDTGFDPNHVAFTKVGNSSESRVKGFYLWNNSTFELQTDLSAVTTDNTSDFHGSHVAGIAAGGYAGPGRYNDGNGVKSYDNLPLTGVAPNADIVMVAAGNELTGERIKSGMDKLVNEYGSTSGQPMVINLSIGDIIGSHSGNGDGMTGSGILDYINGGAIVCVSSGNEGTMRRTINVGGNGGEQEFCVGLPYSSDRYNYYI